jgi:hypothetical protein
MLFLLILFLNFDSVFTVDCALGSLYRVDVDNVADVSGVYAATTNKDNVSSVSQCPYIIGFGPRDPKGEC